jgi:SET domain-containing protein
MKAKLFLGKLIVKKSRIHGYGVFAQKKIKKGELVEECCALVFPGNDDCLSEYAFAFGRKAMVLTGYGCLYNHSDDHNLNHEVDIKNRIVTFKARREIKKGEEIFITYGSGWFKSRDREVKQVAKKKG